MTLLSRRTLLASATQGFLSAVLGKHPVADMRDADSESHHSQDSNSQTSSHLVTGKGASPGQASGQVQRIRIDDDSPGYAPRDAVSGLSAVGRGDIAVMPDLYPYPDVIDELRQAAGFVVYEEESLAGRGPVVARALGVPAMIGCPAAKSLSSGESVILDGTQGMLRTPDRAPSIARNHPMSNHQ